jgi:hypothetical protein
MFMSMHEYTQVCVHTVHVCVTCTHMCVHVCCVFSCVCVCVMCMCAGLCIYVCYACGICVHVLCVYSCNGCGSGASGLGHFSAVLVHTPDISQLAALSVSVCVLEAGNT